MNENITIFFPGSRVTCVVCKATYKDDTVLEAHMQTHKQIFKCDICGELFAEHR